MFDSRITFQKLEIFCKVVLSGGVGKAAEELFLTQPVISAHLKSLQDRLGVELFTRDGRKLKLTEAGHRVYRWATEVLRGTDDLSRELEELSSGVTGSASIGASMSVGNYLLPRLLVDFRKEHPGAQITLQNSNVESALQGVVDGRLNYCFVATYESLDSNTFDAELVGRPKYALIASPQAGLPSQITISELAQLDFVSPPSGKRIRASQDFALSTLGLADRRIVIELGSAESIKFAVIQQLGVSLLWRTSVAQEIADGTLHEIKIEGEEIFDNLYRVQLQGTRLTPLQQNLRNYLAQGMAKILTPNS